jgi:hypothetical protein
VGDSALTSLQGLGDVSGSVITWTCRASGVGAPGLECWADFERSRGDSVRLSLKEADSTYSLAWIRAVTAPRLAVSERRASPGAVSVFVAVGILGLLVVVGFALRFLQGQALLAAMRGIEDQAQAMAASLSQLRALDAYRRQPDAQAAHAVDKPPGRYWTEQLPDRPREAPPPVPQSAASRVPAARDWSQELLSAFPDLQDGSLAARDRLGALFPHWTTASVSGGVVVESKSGVVHLFQEGDGAEWLGTPPPTMRYGTTIHVLDHLDAIFEIDNPDLLTTEGAQFELLRPCRVERVGLSWKPRRKGVVRLKQSR